MDYLDKEIFSKHVIDSYNKKQITEELGKDLMLMCDRLLTSSSFYKYDSDLKKDMKQEGLYKAVRYFKNFDPNKCNNPFNYFTRIFFTTFYTEYGKWNKFYDKRNKLKKLYIEQYLSRFPDKKFMNNFEIEVNDAKDYE